jgi:hypothetical protein
MLDPSYLCSRPFIPLDSKTPPCLAGTAHRHDGPLRGLHRHFSQAKLVEYIRQASVQDNANIPKAKVGILRRLWLA